MWVTFQGKGSCIHDVFGPRCECNHQPQLRLLPYVAVLFQVSSHPSMMQVLLHGAPNGRSARILDSSFWVPALDSQIYVIFPGMFVWFTCVSTLWSIRQSWLKYPMLRQRQLRFCRNHSRYGVIITRWVHGDTVVWLSPAVESVWTLSAPIVMCGHTNGASCDEAPFQIKLLVLQA